MGECCGKSNCGCGKCTLLKKMLPPANGNNVPIPAVPDSTGGGGGYIPIPVMGAQDQAGLVTPAQVLRLRSENAQLREALGRCLSMNRNCAPWAYWSFTQKQAENLCCRAVRLWRVAPAELTVIASAGGTNYGFVALAGLPCPKCWNLTIEVTNQAGAAVDPTTLIGFCPSWKKTDLEELVLTGLSQEEILAYLEAKDGRCWCAKWKCCVPADTPVIIGVGEVDPLVLPSLVIRGELCECDPCDVDGWGNDSTGDYQEIADDETDLSIAPWNAVLVVPYSEEF